MTSQQIMQECFRLALLGKAQVSPNPMVGAVLVRDGRILARGYHRRFGGPHAEVECLRHFRGNVRNATLYVNLEPCSHHGKTPPCVDLIVARGVRSVVAAMKDPNPSVAGRGIRMLRRAGVKVTVGILEGEARALNRMFATSITARRPYVHVKIAQSRDGRITGGGSRWISSAESRKRVHAMRAECDAVLIGAGTVRTDNPSLTVRKVKGRNPDVAILDGAFSLPLRMKLFARNQSRRVFLFTTTSAVQERPGKAKSLASRGIKVVALRGGGERLRLHRVLTKLHRLDVGSVLVEGGSGIFTQFLAEGLVDELTLFVAPDYFGTGLPAIHSEAMRTRRHLTPESITVGRSGRDSTINVLFKQPTN